MALQVEGGNCNNPIRPTKCTVPNGAFFTLSVDALSIPAGGYTLMQTAIDLGGKLIYSPTASGRDEIVWPDANPAVVTRATINGTVLIHGALSGLFPPLPISNYVGNVVQIALACPDMQVCRKCSGADSVGWLMPGPKRVPCQARPYRAWPEMTRRTLGASCRTW